MAARNFKETRVYKIAYEQAMEIFKLSKTFPSEEKYSLTDQVEEHPEAYVQTFAEAYGKKKYPAHFVLKITDSDAENSAADVWFDFSKDCKYISDEIHTNLIGRNEEIGRLLNHMINNPDKY